MKNLVRTHCMSCFPILNREDFMVWRDEENCNEFSCSKYTKEEAEAIAETLIECNFCLDCERCTKCVNCIECRGCNNSNSCTYCKEDTDGCCNNYCISCTDVMFSDVCIKCTGCRQIKFMVRKSN